MKQFQHGRSTNTNNLYKQDSVERVTVKRRGVTPATPDRQCLKQLRMRMRFGYISVQLKYLLMSGLLLLVQ